MLTWALPVHTDAKVVWLIDLRYPRRKFRQGSELICSLVFSGRSDGWICRYWSVDDGKGSNNGLRKRCLNSPCRIVVGTHGDVLPKSIVLFSEI